MKHYRQSVNSNYCGPYSVLSLLSFYGLEISKPRMVRYFGGQKKIKRVGGVRCEDVSNVLLDKFDIKTYWKYYATKRGMESFFKRNVNTPTIISYDTKRSFSPHWLRHFSVMQGIKYNKVKLLDPLLSTGDIDWGKKIKPESVDIKGPYMIMHYGKNR